MTELYDVLMVNMETHKVTVLFTDKTPENADRCERLAIMRRGTDDCFFVSAPAGAYDDGDEWRCEDD